MKVFLFVVVASIVLTASHALYFDREKYLLGSYELYRVTDRGDNLPTEQWKPLVLQVANGDEDEYDLKFSFIKPVNLKLKLNSDGQFECSLAKSESKVPSLVTNLQDILKHACENLDIFLSYKRGITFYDNNGIRIAFLRVAETATSSSLVPATIAEDNSFVTDVTPLTSGTLEPSDKNV